MNKDFLQRMKQELEQQKLKIEKDLLSIADPDNQHETPGNFATRFEDVGRSEDENAGEVDSYQNRLSQKANLEEYRNQVMAALERIEDGSYGVCSDCGEEIAEARLQAFPAATLCVKCAGGMVNS